MAIPVQTLVLVVMPLHIGIVACSAEGAALCYRTLCSEVPARLGPHAHPEVTMRAPLPLPVPAKPGAGA